MSLKIGAYKAGNNPITRFQKSENIERLFNIADKNIGFDLQKSLNRDQVVNLLNQFGQTGERALKELPANAEKFEYFAAHGALEITLNDNNVILLIKKIKNPVSEMIKSIPHRIKNFIK